MRLKEGALALAETLTTGWLANPKDLLWLIALAALFCWFTYWIFNGWVVAGLLLGFGVKLCWGVWFSVDIAKNAFGKSGGLELVTEDEYPALMGTVRRCCRSANIPVPPVYLHNHMGLNAFTTGRNKNACIIVVTRGFLMNATPTELKGIISHEVAHIMNRDVLNSAICSVFCEALEFQAKWITRVAKILLSFLVVKETTRRSRKKQEIHIIWFLLILVLGVPIWVIGLMAHVVSFIAHLIMYNLSRTIELRADITGARLSKDPIALADALETLDRVEAASLRQGSSLLPLSIRQRSIVHSIKRIKIPVDESFLGEIFAKLARNLQSTHPTIEERVKRLHAMDPTEPGS